MSLIMPALPFKQGKTQMYIASAPIEALERFSVDIWNPKNILGRRGYQRKPDEKRVRSIAKYLERRASIMPVAGLLNVREKGKLKFSKGKLIIPDGIEVWVVDMQHRLKGLVLAHDEGLARQFEFPIVITEGLSQVDEAAQFYVINTKAKKMDVALTRRLLIDNDRILDIADVKPWEIAATKITIDLNKKIAGNPWYEVLRQPNEDKTTLHLGTETSFVSSLRQLLIAGRHGQPHKLAKRLANYWSAIRLNIPEAFQEPRRSLVQKTAGMFVFNFFLAPILFAKWSDQEMEKKLARLRKVGPKFWNRANKMGARRFGTGMGGYSNLADHIKKHLL